LQSWMPCASSW